MNSGEKDTVDIEEIISLITGHIETYSATAATTTTNRNSKRLRGLLSLHQLLLGNNRSKAAICHLVLL
jgi:hypothetical protein